MELQLRKIFKEQIKKPPEDIKYIFLTDVDFLAENLLNTEMKYLSVYITPKPEENAFTTEEFTSLICTSEAAYARDYYYLPICTAARNKELQTALKANYFKYSGDAWKVFRSKDKNTDYFKQHEEELVQIANDYIRQCEGTLTRGNVSVPKPQHAVLTPSQIEADEELNKLYSGTDYFVKGGCLWRYIPDKAEKLLSDFVPIPTATLKKDDGLTIEMFFKIGARTASGKNLHEVLIPADKLNSMQWVTSSWGFEANYAPGSTVKDYMRHAIMAAGDKHAIKEDVFTYTGWRKKDSEWIYLYNGGAVGMDGVTVELEGNLSNYTFPEAALDYTDAVRSSLQFIKTAPERITIPILSLVYISPLNEFLRQVGFEPAYIIYLLGITGAMKSTLAALALSHFGRFTGKNLPGSFKDTANALEKKGFLLKDSLTVIDDYHPSMQKTEAAKMERTAQEITRSYGDRTGRGRMNSDTSLRGSYVPRGNLIITGEDTPNIGQSGIARHLILEIGKGDIDKELLSALQANSGSLNLAMRGYIEWLMPQAAELPDKLKDKFIKYRDKAQNDSQHARMPETVAWLQIGYEVLLDYAASLRLVDSSESLRMKQDAFTLFMNLANEQSARIENDKPVAKFINTLREMLSTGVCYVHEIKDIKGSDEINGIGFIGYVDDDYYYLHCETLYKNIFEFYSKQGLNFPVTKDTLLKQLDTEGLIMTETRAGRVYRVKGKRIGGQMTRFMWLRKSALEIREPINLKKVVI